MSQASQWAEMGTDIVYACLLTSRAPFWQRKSRFVFERKAFANRLILKYSNNAENDMRQSKLAGLQTLATLEPGELQSSLNSRPSGRHSCEQALREC